MEEDDRHLAAEFSISHSDFEIIQENLQDNMSLCKTLQQAEEELELWQSRIDNLESVKSGLICAKLDAEEKRKKISHELYKLNNEHEKLQGEIQKTEQSFKEKLIDKETEREQLKERLIELEKQLRIKQEECGLLHTKFKIKATLPEKNIRFTELKESVSTAEEEEDFLKIKCCYVILPKVSLALRNGQALITFENEQVANTILKIPKHHINLEPGKLDVKLHPVKLGTARKFEVHVDICRKTVKVSQIPENLPEEQMRDKLEISFSKPSLGGGEVENVSYDRNTGTALVTFVEKGTAQRVAEKKKFTIILNEKTSCSVSVESVQDYSLEKFQTFNGICKRTVMISDIKNAMEEEELQDKLEIHFQKPSNYGGEVENIKYVPQNQYLTVYFEEDKEAIQPLGFSL